MAHSALNSQQFAANNALAAKKPNPLEKVLDGHLKATHAKGLATTLFGGPGTQGRASSTTAGSGLEGTGSPVPSPGLPAEAAATSSPLVNATADADGVFGISSMAAAL